MSVLAQSVGNLWRVMESYGLDPEPAFLAEGLNIQWPIAPGTRVPYEELDAVRANAAAASGDPAFGLRAGQCVHPSQLGALGYAVLASETLRDSFNRVARFARVISENGYIEVFERDQQLVCHIGTQAPSRNSGVRDDVQLSILVALCRFNAGPDFNPVHVTTRRPEPDNRLPWETFYRCPVQFDAEHNELSMTLAQADQILPSANNVLAEMNDRIVIQRLAELERDNIPGRVRAAIMDQLPSGYISDESVADALNMTPRTLHRRLKVDGESFRTLLKEVRQDLARQYVADDSLTLTEVTFLLGFSEMSSFSRAYKNWYGHSPSVARQS